MTNRYFILIFLLGLGMSAANAQEQNREEGIAEKWIAEWGEKWWERYHDEVDSQYPGGRSNKYHDSYIQEALKKMSDQAWTDWKISNRHYLFEDDWFAVEWFYQASQPSTGLVQLESTLAFGRIEDDHLRVWIEYFDDMVGKYQSIGVMKLFDKENEVPYPWPKDTQLKKKYRP